MRPQHIEMIVAIAEAGSLGAAAEALGKTQPALTKALKRAEHDLGAQLFHRGSHGALPTAEGQRVIERCRRILRDLQSVDDDIAQGRGAVTGRLSVIVSPLAAIRILPPVLARFRRRFGAVRLQISGGHPPTAFHALQTAEADFVIGPAPLPGEAPALVAENLVQTGVTLLTGKGARFAGETHPKALVHADWAVIGPANRRSPFADHMTALGLDMPDPVVTSDSILSITSLLESSDLICSFPSLAVPDILARWNLTALPIDPDKIAVDVALTRAKDRIPTPAALAFADLVRAEGKVLRDQIIT